MKKPRKHYTAVEKVAILQGRLLASLRFAGSWKTRAC